MRLTEEQYAKLWMRHRILEVERQRAKQGVRHKVNTSRGVSMAIRKIINSGKWFTSEEIANRIKASHDTVEEHLIALRKDNIVMSQHLNGFVCYRLKGVLEP